MFLVMSQAELFLSLFCYVVMLVIALLKRAFDMVHLHCVFRPFAL